MSACLFQPLDAASLAELKVALNGFLQKGETIKLETKVESVTSNLPLTYYSSIVMVLYWPRYNFESF